MILYQNICCLATKSKGGCGTVNNSNKIRYVISFVFGNIVFIDAIVTWHGM